MAMMHRGASVPMFSNPIKHIDDLTLEPAPPISHRTMVNLKQALNDRESYSALLLLNVPKSASRATKRLIGQLAGTPLFSANITEEQNAFVTVNRGAENILKNLHRVDEGATLYVHWDAPLLSEPDLEAAAGRDVAEQIKDMLRKKSRPMATSVERFTTDVQAQRPDIKVVVAVPAADVGNKDLAFVEVMGADQIPYAFDAVSFAQRVNKYVDMSLPSVDKAQALRALRCVDNAMLKDIVRHARVLTMRRRSEEPHLEHDGIAALEDAVKVFERRAHGPQGAEDAGDTSFARQYLVPDRILKEYRLDTHVAGVHQDVKDFTKMLRNYDTYKKYLPEANKNLLLEGPVGTGKTTIARAIAAELGYPLFAPKSSELINAYIGKSAANVYRLFKQVNEYARQRDTTAVLFIDEADAVLARRGGGQNSEREYARVVNAFLESLEGLDEDACNRLVVVLSTNLSEHLDPGIASRFGSKVEVPLPDAGTLHDIFKIHLKGRVHTLCDDDITKLAALAHGFSGRDVVNVLRTADRTVFARMAEGAGAPPAIDFALMCSLVRAEVAKRATGMNAPPPEGLYV